ncbi:hypothetical protein BDQ17DRAFT_1266166, partial [Cyathus striatus]
RDRHPNWEQILSGNELFCSLIEVTIEEQEKLRVPEVYQGNSMMTQTGYDTRQSHQSPPTT